MTLPSDFKGNDVFTKMKKEKKRLLAQGMNSAHFEMIYLRRFFVPQHLVLLFPF